MTSRSYWTAVWCGFLVLTIGLGVRQSFGIFLKPISAELHVGRELFSFGTALSMLLMGFFAPFFRSDFEIHVWGPPSATLDLRTRLARYLSPPLFPIRLRDVAAPGMMAWACHPQ